MGLKDVSMNKKSSTLKVVVHSKNWTHQVAIEYMYLAITQASEFIKNKYEIDAFLRNAIETQPNLIIIDEAPRNTVSLILTLRQQCPDAVIIFTQEEFLFSDKIVVEYFNGIASKNYDVLMSEAASCLLTEYHCLLSALKDEGNLATDLQWRTQGVSATLQAIKRLMHVRFSHLIGSPRAQEVVFSWLVKGVEPATVGRLLGCSSKVVYHYRSMAMKVLGIQNRTRDFIASLTVTAGPVSYCQLGARQTAVVHSLPHEQVNIKKVSIDKSVLTNVQDSRVCSVCSVCSVTV